MKSKNGGGLGTRLKAEIAYTEVPQGFHEMGPRKTYLPVRWAPSDENRPSILATCSRLLQSCYKAANVKLATTPCRGLAYY